MLEKLIEQAKKINKMNWEAKELSGYKKILYLSEEISKLYEIVEREDLSSYGLIFRDFHIRFKNFDPCSFGRDLHIDIFFAKQGNTESYLVRCLIFYFSDYCDREFAEITLEKYLRNSYKGLFKKKRFIKNWKKEITK